MIKQATIAIIFILVMAVAAIPQTAIAGSGGSRFFDESLDDLQGNSTRSRYYYKKHAKKSKKRRKRTRRKKKSSAAPAVSAEEVRVQNALQTAGFYHGPLDGKLDSYASRVAIMQYQLSYELPQTGELTSDLKGVLLQQADIAELSGHLINAGVTQQDEGKRLQAALKVQGHYTATIDGDFGPKSLAAMRLYQQAKGMTPSGALLPDQEQELVAASIQLLHNQQAQSDQVLTKLKEQQPSQQATPGQTPPEQASDHMLTQETVAGQLPSAQEQQSQPDTQQVLFANQALKQRGYQVDASDGVYDSEIRETVINFQKDTGMEQSGELNTETLAAMNGGNGLEAELDAPVNPNDQSDPISEKAQESPIMRMAALTAITELRTEADAFSDTLVELPAGKQVSVNSIEGDWAHVSVDDQHGYVYAEFLDKYNNKSKSSNIIGSESKIYNDDDERLNYEEYIREIRSKIKGNWRKPSGVADGLTASLRVKLFPNGNVKDVTVMQSSGNLVYDLAATDTVKKSSPLPVPKGKDFEKFKSLTLKFSPSGIR